MKYLAISILILILGFFGLLNPLRNSYIKLISPIQFGLSASAHDLKESIAFYTYLRSIRDENIGLKETINLLEAEIFELKTFRDENMLLRKQLGLEPFQSNTHKVVLAQVMGNFSDLTGATIYVDVGSSDGIEKGANVILDKSIIGIVREVHPKKSLVELVTSQNVTMTVVNLDSANKTECLATGQFGTSINLDRILPTEEVKIGDTIATSGKDGFFLPGYIVGKVTEVIDDPSQPLKTASVQTVEDFTNLTKVFVVKE